MKKLMLLLVTLLLTAPAYVFSQDDMPGPPPGNPENENVSIDEGHHGGKHGFGHKMGAEKLEKSITEMEQYAPGIKKLFEQVRDENQGSSMHKKADFIHQIFSDLPFMMKMSRDDSEMKSLMAQYVKLELESVVTAKKVQSAKTAADKEALSAELTDILKNSFEKRQQLRAKKIQHLEKVLEETKNEIAEREKNKDLIIQNRLKDLTQEDKSLEW